MKTVWRGAFVSHWFDCIGSMPQLGQGYWFGCLCSAAGTLWESNSLENLNNSGAGKKVLNEMTKEALAVKKSSKSVEASQISGLPKIIEYKVQLHLTVDTFTRQVCASWHKNLLCVYIKYIYINWTELILLYYFIWHLCFFANLLF